MKPKYQPGGAGDAEVRTDGGRSTLVASKDRHLIKRIVGRYL